MSTKLLPQPLDFIVNYPVGNYLRGLIQGRQNQIACYFVSQKGTGIYISRSNGKGDRLFSSDVHSLSGSPSVDMFDPEVSDSSGLAPSGSYQKDVIRRFGLGRNGRVCVVTEPPRMHLNFHSMLDIEEPLKDIMTALADDPREIIPNWQHQDGFVWTSFTPEIEPAAPLTARASSFGQLFIAGMPSGFVEFMCEWALQSGMVLEAILPLPLAVAGWMLHSWAKDKFYFMVVPAAGAFHLFAFKDGAVLQYFAIPNDNMVKSEISAMIDDTMDSLNISEKTPVYIWPSIGFPVSRLADDFPKSSAVSYVAMDDALAASSIPDTHHMPLWARLADWISGEVFSSYISGNDGNVIDLLKPHATTPTVRKGVAPINVGGGTQ